MNLNEIKNEIKSEKYSFLNNDEHLGEILFYLV